MPTSTVYILRLEDGKFYVGKTTRPVSQRFDEHVNGTGSAWTRRYKPIAVIKSIPNQRPEEENVQVKRSMGNFGVANVRGGAYSNFELLPEQRELLDREIRHDLDLCLECGSSEHFLAQCRETDGMSGVIQQKLDAVGEQSGAPDARAANSLIRTDTALHILTRLII